MTVFRKQIVNTVTTHLQQFILAENVRCVLVILSSEAAMIYLLLDDGKMKDLEGQGQRVDVGFVG